MEDRKTHLQVIFGLIFGVLALFIIIRLFAVPIANNLEDELNDDTDIVDENDQDENETTDEDNYIDVGDSYEPSAYVYGTPSIILNGESIINVQVGTEYNEMGALATDTKYGDISDDVIISGNVDMTTLGTYILTYTVKNKDNVSVTVTRQINVTDLIPPVIEFVGMGGTNGSEIEANPGEIIDLFTLVTVSDNFDEVETMISVYHRLTENDSWVAIDGTSIELNKIGYYRVYYAAKDKFGNISQLDEYFEILVVDNQIPTISANSLDVNVEINSNFDEYSVLSSYDNIEVAKVVAMEYQYSEDDISYSVIDEVSLPKNRLGYYKVKYVAMDTSGNISSEIVVKFNVIDTIKPTYTLVSTETIILDKTEVSTILDDTVYYTVKDNSEALPVVTETIEISTDGSSYVDSLLTSIDLINEGYYRVTYTVTDGSRNFITFNINYRVVDRMSGPSITLVENEDALPNVYSVSIADNFDTIVDFEYILVDSLPVGDPTTGEIDYSIYDGLWMSSKITEGIIGRDTIGTYYIIIKASDFDNNIVYYESSEIIEN